MASTLSTYDLGDRFRVTATFASTAGTNTDPTTITFTYQRPSSGASVTRTYSTASTSQVKRSAAGVYYIDITSTGAGIYTWTWTGSGAVVAVGQGRTIIRPVSV